MYWFALSVLAAIIASCTIIDRFYVPRLRGWIGEKRVRKIIADSGLAAVHDYYCTDANGVPTQIDHLIHLGESIAVIETKNFRNAVFGSPDDLTWTTGHGPFRRKFQNPLRQNKRHVLTLKSNHPNVEFEPLVCFIGGIFPKGYPPGVVNGDVLRATLSAIPREPRVEKNATDVAWSHIETIRATQTSRERKLHRESLQKRFARQDKQKARNAGVTQTP